MPQCPVFGCSNRNDKCNKDIHFHRFPNRDKSPNRFSVWTKYCRRKNFVPSINAMMCSAHFLESDLNESDVMKKRLMPEKKCYQRLKAGAIPTVKEQTENSLTKKYRNARYEEKERKAIVCEILSDIVQTSATSQIPGMDLPLGLVDSDSTICCISEGVQCEMGTEIYRSFVSPSDYTLNLSEDEDNADTLYDANSDSENESDSDLVPPVMTVSNYCYIIFWNCLVELFKLCRTCNSPIQKLSKYSKGAMICVATVCENNHVLQWYSRSMKGKRPLGNIVIASGLLLSGISFAAFNSFCKAIQLVMFSRTVFDRIVTKFIAPQINNIWNEHRELNLQRLRQSEIVWLAGDGRFDSPGFSAKYVMYSVMDLHTGTIIDFKVIQKAMVKGDLEKAAREILLQTLTVDEKIVIHLFLTDRHRGIRYLLRNHHPTIEHEFDVWHLSKSLMKRVKTLDKIHPDAFAWKNSINDHSWWSAQTCKHNGNLLVNKFTSILYHIRNIHQWQSDGDFTQCAHEELGADQQRKKLWLRPDSESYTTLKEIILDKSFLKDLQHAKHYVHTGQLESYHNTRLKYLPKRLHFSYNGMHLRAILSVLDHNSNLNKIKIGEAMHYSKALGK